MQINSQGHKDLNVYKLAYNLAMEIFTLSKSFPKEELYSLTDQVRRSSRSITANLAEAYRKRQYPKMFLSKLADADAELAETAVWIDYAHDCRFLSKEKKEYLLNRYQEVGKMLGSMINHPEKFKITEKQKV